MKNDPNIVDAEDVRGTDPLDQARVVAERGRRPLIRGEPDEAELLLRHALELFTTAGSELEAAAAMGPVADITCRRGDCDEALRTAGTADHPVARSQGGRE